MKYQNNSAKGVVIPVKRNVANEVASTSWIKFHPGEVKDIPEEAIAVAEANGLTKVEDTKEELKEEKPEVAEESTVEAEVSAIADTLVETKQVKRKRK